ncbi:unnamed protein product, partial [Thlaspi arvense]
MGRVAMIGFFMAYFVDSLTGPNGKLLLQNALVCGCTRSSFHPQERRFRQSQGSVRRYMTSNGKQHGKSQIQT